MISLMRTSDKAVKFVTATDSPASATITPLHAASRQAVVVMPALNEAADIGDVASRVRSNGFPVIVVDDDSTDNTASIARAAGADVLPLPFHAGCWAAIQVGMRLALRRGYRFVVTLDADGQHDPADIAGLIAEMDGPDAPDVIIASCPKRANQRRRLAWRVLRRLSGLEVEDLTSGFRVYNVNATEILASEECSLLEYQDVGVLLHLRRNGMRIAERPVSMCQRVHGRSRVFSSWPMVFYYLVYSCLIGTSRRIPRRGRR